MEKAPDNKSLSGSDIPFPFESEIGRRLTMGDICHYNTGVPKTPAELGLDAKGKQIKFDLTNPEHYTVVPKMNKFNKIGKTSWDSFAYSLYMAHNVYCHIVAVQRANQLADIESARFKPNWRNWKKLNSKDSTSDQFSEWVPRNVLYFDQFVEELFATKTLDEAMEMLEHPTAKAFLISLAGSRNTSGGNSDNLIGNLFEFAEITKAEEIDLADADDEQLRALEQGLEE